MQIAAKRQNVGAESTGPSDVVSALLARVESQKRHVVELKPETRVREEL